MVVAGGLEGCSELSCTQACAHPMNSVEVLKAFSQPMCDGQQARLSSHDCQAAGLLGRVIWRQFHYRSQGCDAMAVT